MNFLFHLYLSGDDQELLVGNFMGDFVKGPLGDDYPPRILQGLMLHRKIDSFAQRNGDFQASRLRLSPEIGLYRGVLVDLFYDHFLAKEWDSWSDTPFQEYISWARGAVERHLAVIPKKLKEIVPVIFNELLPSYRRIAGTEAALVRMSGRVKRTNPLAEGGAELARHYEEIKEDFTRFTPAAKGFAAGYIADLRIE